MPDKPSMVFTLRAFRIYALFSLRTQQGRPLTKLEDRGKIAKAS